MSKRKKDAFPLKVNISNKIEASDPPNFPWKQNYLSDPSFRRKKIGSTKITAFNTTSKAFLNPRMNFSAITAFYTTLFRTVIRRLFLDPKFMVYSHLVSILKLLIPTWPTL